MFGTDDWPFSATGWLLSASDNNAFLTILVTPEGHILALTTCVAQLGPLSVPE
jgi:hypothetical protein